jgi:hypothetical protein
LLAGAFFMWNKSCSLPTQLTSTPRAGSAVAGSMSGGPVRQWEHEATDMTAREQALPGPAGVSAGTMVDTARRGLQ